MTTYKYKAWINIKEYHHSISVQCERLFHTIPDAIAAINEIVIAAPDNVDLLSGRTVTPVSAVITANDSEVWSESY